MGTGIHQPWEGPKESSRGLRSSASCCLSSKGLLRCCVKTRRPHSLHRSPQDLAILVTRAQCSLLCTWFLFPGTLAEHDSTLRSKALSQIWTTHLTAVVPLGVGRYGLVLSLIRWWPYYDPTSPKVLTFAPLEASTPSQRPRRAAMCFHSLAGHTTVRTRCSCLFISSSETRRETAVNE